MDDCQKSVLIFDDVISSCEIVNSKSVKVQCTGKIPTYNIDKTDGIIVYLGEKSIDATIFTSKSSEMNVSVPGKTEEDDSIELPIPEQFLTCYDESSKKFKTHPNSSHF
jgi:adenylyl cyclase-associated protein